MSPDLLNRWLMTVVRAIGLGSKQKGTYSSEAKAIAQFAKTLEQ